MLNNLSGLTRIQWFETQTGFFIEQIHLNQATNNTCILTYPVYMLKFSIQSEYGLRINRVASALIYA